MDSYAKLAPLVVIILATFLCREVSAGKPSTFPLATGNAHKHGIFQLPQLPSSIRCGEVLTSPDSGISYKAFETVMPDERCIWTIAVPEAKSYEISVMHMGFPTTNGEEQIIISAFGKPNTTIHVAPKTPGNYTFQTANILVITFLTTKASDLNKRTGFILQYVAKYSGEGEASNEKSSHYFLTLEMFQFEYPQGGASYLANELSSFVFLPEDNKQTQDREINIFYFENGIDRDCIDFLSVYFLTSYSISRPERWESRGIICGGTSALSIRHSDLVLIVFESDNAVQGKGFNFTIVEC